MTQTPAPPPYLPQALSEGVEIWRVGSLGTLHPATLATPRYALRSVNAVQKFEILVILGISIPILAADGPAAKKVSR